MEPISAELISAAKSSAPETVSATPAPTLLSQPLLQQLQRDHYWTMNCPDHPTKGRRRGKP
jgi:hypothetical protein